jgi:uncharacterized protein (TIGR03437 family)
MMLILALLWILASSLAFGQRPPVILIDGYHLLCQSENLSSDHDFGALQPKLEAEGVRVVYLGTCSFTGKPSIEALGDALGTAIRNLNVLEVDLVSHSLGGLVVRSYLSGKQTDSGKFAPPRDPKVRKWVSIATPNFGALIPDVFFGFLPDVQTRELAPGSQFLFDLATWNQNHDDLRGVDAVGIIGNAGGFGPFEGGSDGTVAVTSASLSFAERDERTRILPYCHGAGTLTSILGLGCDAPPLARIQSDNPLSWQIIDSFLAGSDAWKAIGHSPSQDRQLSQYGGVLSQARDNIDRPTGLIQDQTFVVRPPLVGAYAVVIQKAGPQIAAVLPSAARLDVLSLAPRMLISIYGSNLSNARVTVNGQSLALNYTSDRQINALLPDNLSGLATLAVSNDSGKQTVNILLAEAMPAVFTMDGSGQGPAAAIRIGDSISLYLTGLGLGGVTAVTLDGAPVTVTYAGPAPGFPGLDQINVQLPPGTASGLIVVFAGKRASNAVMLPPAPGVH